MLLWEGILYAILALVGIIFALMIALYIGKTVTMGFCHIDKRLDGKVVLITGIILKIIKFSCTSQIYQIELFCRRKQWTRLRDCQVPGAARS